MKGWHAVLSALLFFIAAGAQASEDGAGAARELARKTIAFAGRGELVSVGWNNVSTLGSSELFQVRSAFEAAFREAGGRLSDIAPLAEARITLSENRTQYLLAEEIRKGEDRQVYIASWKRSDSATVSSAGVTLDKKLVWEQEEQMLDVAFPGAVMAVLSPSRLSVYARQNGPWSLQEAVPLNLKRPLPRDPRGHLRIGPASLQAYLPGLACSGTVDPAVSFECRPSEEPWVLESGSRSMLLGYYVPARNYFDGRITLQSGLKKTVNPFYSAASVDEQGRPLWLLAMVDGRTQVLDASLDPAGSIPSWGSDLVGTEARCAGGSQVLATRPGEGTVPDAIQAYSMVNRVPTPLTAPMEFPGPITAFWASGGTSAMAIARNLQTGRYEAYVITVSCQ